VKNKLSKINVGIDLDNTIISYNNSFLRLAKKYNLNKRKVLNKNILKKNIIKKFGMSEWTKCQGKIYGKEILINNSYEDVKKNLLFLKKKFNIFLISHRSKYPYLGKKIDLHKQATKWLNKKKFLGKKKIFEKKNIFFETSLQKKIIRINKLNCQIFIDDLLLVLKRLPISVAKIHFTNNVRYTFSNYYVMKKWKFLPLVLKKILRHNKKRSFFEKE
jgi:hypothetical protein